jgi:hypothetical protein
MQPCEIEIIKGLLDYLGQECEDTIEGIDEGNPFEWKYYTAYICMYEYLYLKYNCTETESYFNEAGDKLVVLYEELENKCGPLYYNGRSIHD